jgi:pyruvate kinase
MEQNKNIITDPCHTKIVCTLGPASSSDEVLEQMILAGMDVVRLNFSHGEHSAHKELFDRVRRLSKKYNDQVEYLLQSRRSSNLVLVVFVHTVSHR